MLHIIGTVEDAEKIKDTLPFEVYQTALNIVTALDSEYGADRNITTDDGGVVVIADTVQDIAEITERYFPIDTNRHESVELINCKKDSYVNALFLLNNDFGVNVIIPCSIAPSILLNEAEGLSSQSN